ncbi:MAG TPA: S1-like domain-containing RNA-binding protein [Chitinophagales bacterium]|nr:S1-like domain-containing RNA-binding protein [Chitinophagales bacterium]
MLQFGQYNKLQISRKTDNGFYLSETEGEGVLEEVLLPNKFITAEMKEGQTLHVFVYKDSEDRPVATTQIPKAIVGEAEYLTVKQLTSIGAFLDWGLDKDLLLPFREQSGNLREGEKCLVFVYFDFASKRIAATNNLNKFIKNREVTLKTNDEVSLLICDETEIGFKVIINNKHWGMLYKNEIFGKVTTGELAKGFIKKLREDGKIDVALQKQGIKAAKDTKDVLLEKLKENGGVLQVSDSSGPEVIYQLLGISKKNFKKAAGMLLKAGLINIGDDRITLK